MCVCVYACMTHATEQPVCTYIHMYMYICMYDSPIEQPICICMHMYMYVRMCVCMHASSSHATRAIEQSVCIYILMCMYVHMYACVYACVYVYVHAYVYVLTLCMNIYMYICIKQNSSWNIYFPDSYVYQYSYVSWNIHMYFPEPFVNCTHILTCTYDV